jgi:hypothetical protein
MRHMSNPEESSRMKRLGLTALLAVVILALSGAREGLAGTVALKTTGQGWINNGGDNGNSPTNNYLAGNCGSRDCGAGEFRDFFQFDIPILSAPVISAELLLDTGHTRLAQSPSLNYQLTSLPGAFGFDDLGTGTVYATRTYTSLDASQVESIELNAAALGDIVAAAGGTFGVGGRVISATTFGPTVPSQDIFGLTGGAQILVINLRDVPEPGSLLLLGSALGGLAVCRWRACRPREAGPMR